MPHIHSILQTESSRHSARSEEERREELRLLVGGLTAGVAPTERIGMEWGTCMVFSCEADCAGGESAKQGGSHWAEEFVLVQWDG
jgi:pre-rRNA-processing protein TSR4